jgi:uncharacterized protein (TIGR02118 family)
MIKSLSLLTRKEGMTHDEFVTHWTKVHAPMAHAVPGLRRYVLTHILGERTRPDIPSIEGEVDGIAELWYDDRESMQKANASPEAKRLHADGATFIGRIKMFTTEEQIVIPHE